MRPNPDDYDNYALLSSFLFYLWSYELLHIEDYEDELNYGALLPLTGARFISPIGEESPEPASAFPLPPVI
jgi:hypothetical protein